MEGLFPPGKPPGKLLPTHLVYLLCRTTYASSTYYTGVRVFSLAVQIDTQRLSSSFKLHSSRASFRTEGRLLMALGREYEYGGNTEESVRSFLGACLVSAQLVVTVP